MKKIKRFGLVSLGTLSGLLAAAVPAFAVGTADTAVTAALTTTADDSVATLGAIAPIAISIFGAIFVWQIGKRVFKIVAK